MVVLVRIDGGVVESESGRGASDKHCSVAPSQEQEAHLRGTGSVSVTRSIRRQSWVAGPFRLLMLVC